MNNIANNHINISGGSILPTALFEKLINDTSDASGIITTFDEQKTVGSIWQLRSHSFFSIEISHLYYVDFLATGHADILYNFLQIRLELIWGFLKKMDSGGKDAISEYSIEKMEVLYCGSNGINMYFRYTMKLTEEEEKNAWNKMIHIIGQYEKSEEKIMDWLKSVPVQKDKLRYFQLDAKNEMWVLCDPLEKVVSDLSVEYYKQKKDSRVRKPHIIVNEEKYNEHFVWDQQWSLDFAKKTIVLPPPNDIALYLSLADKNLSRAKELFFKEQQKFKQPYYNPLLKDDEAAIIYDYFELIMSAIIFSYTAVETLANTCIANDYKYTKEEDGITTIYSQYAIERKFKLREKLKIILREILKTPDPTQEKWWSHFIRLEDIRNELIHVKKGKSQEIFSALLSENIFKPVMVAKEIVTYYGFYVNQNQRNILIDFPYNFGSDSVIPKFMTKKDYWDTWRNMRGIPKPKHDDTE